LRGLAPKMSAVYFDIHTLRGVALGMRRYLSPGRMTSISLIIRGIRVRYMAG
jgi:hypothetical protein